MQLGEEVPSSDLTGPFAKEAPPRDPPTKVVYIGLEIPDEACEMVLQTAYEGGIGYWATGRNVTYAKQDLSGPAGGPTDTFDILYWSYELADKEILEIWYSEELIKLGVANDEMARQAARNAAQRIEDDAEHGWWRVDYNTIRLGIKRLFDHPPAPAFKMAQERFLQDYAEWTLSVSSRQMVGNRRLSRDVIRDIFGGQTDAGDCDTIVQLGIFGELVYG